MRRIGTRDDAELAALVASARKHGPALTVLIVLTGVMCRNLIFSSEFPGGWDVASINYPIAYFAEIDSYFSLWEDSVTGYVTPITLFHLLASVADLLGDPALVSRAVLVLATLLSALFAYLYCFATTGRRLASLSAGIIFATSPHLVAHTASGHGFLVLAYTLTPLLFLLVDRGLAQVTASRVLGLGLALSFLPSLRIDPIAYILPFLLLFALWHVIIAGRRWRAAAINAILILVPAVALAGVLSAYVWLPLLWTGTAHATIRFGLDAIAGTSLSLWPSLVGQSLIYSYLFWKGDTAYYTHQFLPPIVYGTVLMVVPALAFAQVRLRDNRRVSFFVTAALISVFLAKGPLPPLGEVYSFLWQHVPFVNQLHVPNRWLMITWFAYAFLAGLTMERLYHVLRNALGTVVRPSFARTASSAVLALLVLGSAVGVSYAFTDGYQTWQVPQEELEPHRWLGEKHGEGRFLGVPFEGERGFVSGGWLQHDLGVTGGMLNGRPSFDRPGFGGAVGDFFACLEALVEMKVQSVAKIIGAYDVRYVVAQGYSGNALMRHDLAYSDMSSGVVVQEYSEHEYFDNLAGLTKVFEAPEPKYTLLVGVSTERDLTELARRSTLWPLQPEKRAAVYENEYWLPRGFVPKARMLVVGGPETLATLADWDEFNFQDWGIHFAARTLTELGRSALIDEVRGTDLLILNNSELLDLAMMMSDSRRVDLGAAARDLSTQWRLADSSSDFVEERNVLWTTINHAHVKLPVDLGQTPRVDQFELWARVHYGPRTPVIRFEVDGQQVGSVLPRARQEMGFVWQRVGTVSLGPGSHYVRVTALGTGGAFSARLDELALVGVGAVDEAADLLATIVRESHIPVASLQDGRRVWKPSGASTELSRFSQLNIAPDDLREAGVRRVLYGGQPEIPDSLSRGRFFVRRAYPEGGYAPLLQLEFEETQDWRDAIYLSLDFKGVGRGDKVRLRVAFAGLGTAYYSFEDLSSRWEVINIPLFDPERTEGTMRWDQVSMLLVDTSRVDMAGGVGLGTIRIVKDSSGLERLSSKLGMRTLMRSAWDPTPTFAATLLSASGDQPAEIVSWIRASPWEYRFRVVADAPYDLVVSNTYDPLWRVILDGREIAPHPAYYIVSSYDIDKVGEHDLILEFVGQRYQWIAFALSGLTYGATVVALAVCLLRARRRGPGMSLGSDANRESRIVSHDR